MEIFKLFGSIFIDNDNANASIDETESKGQGLSKTFGGLGTAATNAGKLIGGALLAGTGLAGVGIGTMILAGDELQKALNGLQSQTGATSDEMTDMGDSIKEIYGNNYGESFDQIAEVMANARKTTGAWGEDLKYLTQDALMLSDTFGYDTNESIRSADKLMKQFGINGTEAMALIAEGSQKGLNYADDLLPTIDEYSVYFEQAGFSASEMFGLFENAKNNGTFNLDYAADAVKEFGILMTEQGGAATETLDNMGLAGADLQQQFAKGGEGAKKALQTVAQALADQKNPQKQYTDGVALFGTKFEDVGAQGILSMLELNNSIKGSTDVLEGINNVKYDTFGEAMTGIGRIITTGLILPLSEKAMPFLNKFSDWLRNGVTNIDFDAVISGISSFVSYLITFFSPILEETKNNLQFLWDKFKENGGVETAKDLFEGFKSVLAWIKDNTPLVTAVLTGLGGALLTFQILTGINKAIGLFNTLMIAFKTGTLGATLAQWGLNTALLANPFTWIALAVGVLIGAVVLLWKNWDEVSKWLGDSWDWIKLKAKTVFGGIGDFVSGLKDKAVNKFNDLKNQATEKITSLLSSAKNKFNDLKNKIVDTVSNAKNSAVSKFNDLKNGAIEKAASLYNSVKGKFESLKDKITSPINKAKDGVKSAIDKIKGFFSNLKLKLPDIKTPHFKLKNWSKNPLDWLDAMPSIGLEWYAKGTDYAKGGLSVVGEHGMELVNLPKGSQVKTASETRALMKDYQDQPIVIQPAPVVLDGRVVAEVIFPSIQDLQYDDMTIKSRMAGVKI